MFFQIFHKCIRSIWFCELRILQQVHINGILLCTQNDRNYFWTVFYSYYNGNTVATREIPMRETIKISNRPLVVNTIRFYMSVKIEFMAFVKRRSRDVVRGCASALIHREAQRDYFIAIIRHVSSPLFLNARRKYAPVDHRIPFTRTSYVFLNVASCLSHYCSNRGER